MTLSSTRRVRQAAFAVVTSVFVLAGAAHAQPAPTPDPPAPPVVDEVPSPPPEEPVPEAAPAAPASPASPAASPADATRLDDIEQLVRITARKQELDEEQAAKSEEAAKKAALAPTALVDDKGFGLSLPDKSYAIKIRALVQADGRFFAKDDVLAANDTFLIRRFRPSLDGTLFSLIDYRLLPEFAGTVQILDAYADIHPWLSARLRIGKFKGPIGLERLQSDADLPLLERALDSNASSTREVGVQLWGDLTGGIAQYSLAIVNGAVDGASPDTDINHAKDLAARVFFQPFRAESLQGLGSLGVGLAGSIGNRKGRLPTATVAAVTGLPVFRTGGQNTFFQYLAPATDTTGATTVFTHEITSHLNPQLYYYYDTFGLLAEYVVLRQGVQKGNTTTTLTHQSAHATLSYAFKGRAGFDGVTPLAPFDLASGTIGAFEIATRLAWFKADPDSFGDPKVSGSVQYADPLRSARSAQSWTVGATWIPRRSFHLALNFEQTSFKGGAGTAAAPADRLKENVFIGRAQVNF